MSGKAATRLLRKSRRHRGARDDGQWLLLHVIRLAMPAANSGCAICAPSHTRPRPMVRRSASSRPSYVNGPMPKSIPISMLETQAPDLASPLQLAQAPCQA